MADSTTKDVRPLSTPAQFLKGVGPQRAEKLAKLELKTAADLLFFFPRDYEDLSAPKGINELADGEPATVCGVVEEVEMRGTAGGKSILGVLVSDGIGHLRATWFNQPFLQTRYRQGQRLLISGTPHLRGVSWEMTHPRVDTLAEDEAPPAGRVLPVYSLTSGISQFHMRRIVSQVVDDFAAQLEEVFPVELLEHLSLWPIQRAVKEIHQPADREHLELARRRFIYQELLVLQLAVAMRRWRQARECRAPQLPPDGRIHARIVRLFPFELTAAQAEAIDEIGADMARDVPMNRMLQGDVGSGKTVVAQYAMMLASAHGHQSALMAPTEILAAQHAATLSRSLESSRLRIGLLSGSLSAGKRKKLLEEVAAGEIDLLIGTQAIVQSEIQFHKLGLVIIDEQHKFGVQQRATLRDAGVGPHYLVMTATPIPRTVAMTVFGDLDVSTLRQAPPGRQQVKTYWGEEAQRDKWWDFFRRKLGEGRQGYVIAPLVDEDGGGDLASVEQLYESLANGELEEFRIGLVHGRLPAAQKQNVMESFAAGELQVLVATSVVEVGIDVPNACLMTIEGAERFGLAQLHQLRGRVSRGAFPGYVCLFAEPGSEESRERLNAFVGSTDGFELAEVDFRLRGPGNLFGTRQHGLPPLLIADLQRDDELLAAARSAAQEIVEADPELSEAGLQKLRDMVLRRYGEALELVDVG